MPDLKNEKRESKPSVKGGAAIIRDWLSRYPLPWRLVLGVSFLGFCILLVSPVRSSLQGSPGRWMYIFLVSFLLSLWLSSVAVVLAMRIGAVDIPDRRKIHDRPTPRLGGIAVFAGIVVALVMNNIWDPLIARLVICSSILFALGVVEDSVGVSARLRLLAQVVLALFLVYSGLILKVLPQGMIGGQVVNAVLTVVWFVGITNAFNFFDGMDGLASGLAILMSAFLGSIAFLTDQVQLGWISVAILGTSFGFLPHNFKIKKPAEIFLGDSGSTLLGFLLAGLAVHGEWAVGHPLLNLSPPLLIFGVLIYDMFHTTISRISRGDVRTFRSWIEYTGKDHLHHRFEALLRSKRYSVLLVLVLTFCLGLAATVIRHLSLTLALVLLLQCLVILFIITILERAGNIHERRNISDSQRE